jgi:cephalosporin-C deacetylase-like acetyl esterase
MAVAENKTQTFFGEKEETMLAEEIRKFWEQTRAALAEVKMEATVEPVEQSDVFTMEGGVKTRTIFRVIMSSFEGRRIRAWYTVPTGQPPSRGWPAIMEVPGYGGILPLPVRRLKG